MASGTFDKSVGKVRPGTYINFEDHDTSLVSGGTSGVVVIPFVNTDYGPAKSFIKITADALDAAKPYLGYSINDDDPAENMLLVREAFRGATTVIVYVCTEGTKAAAADGGGLTATALYKGARGNDLSYAVLEDPIGGFDVEVYLAGSKVEEFDGITSADAIASNYISFKSSGDLTEIAGVNLTGGTSATTENADVTAFLDALDAIAFNTICFPLTEQSLQASLKAKVKYIRENTFKKVQGVTANFDADYEGIINVTNAYALGSGDLTPAQATAYVAGITAGASNVESNTYRTVDGATGVVGLKSNDAAIEAINKGEFFFSVNDSDEVVCEYDINSLHTFTTKKGKNYRKNRVIRVFDTFAAAIQSNFPPNKYDNDPDGWETMKGVGKAILKRFGPRSDGGVGAIKNIDYDADFQIDEENSTGDQTYFNIGLEPVDSAEKLYFTINTR